jgi:hypothetical protein
MLEGGHYEGYKEWRISGEEEKVMTEKKKAAKMGSLGYWYESEKSFIRHIKEFWNKPEK